MKMLLRILAAAMLIIAAVVLVNCADPLEPVGLVSPVGPHDTVYQTDTVTLTDTVVDQDTITNTDTVIVTDTFDQVDTVILVDTVVETDTLNQTDTVIVVDTLNEVDTIIIVDTIIVTPPDTCRPLLLCARLSSHRKEIVWMLGNLPGSYRLEFEARVEQGQPPKTLLVNINGSIITWYPKDMPVLVLEQALPANTIVKIKPDIPLSYGHEVDICLKLTKL